LAKFEEDLAVFVVVVTGFAFDKICGTVRVVVKLPQFSFPTWG
jgi:hypothetical protein